MKRVLALDIGGTNFRLALINDTYQILETVIHPTPTHNLDQFLTLVSGSIAQMIEKYPDILAIGCGVPGRVDALGGIEILPNIGIRHVPLMNQLSLAFQRPIIIKNDAVMAAVAEGTLGFGKDLESSYFITISTGIGAAFIRHKHLTHSSEEVGHMLVPFAQGYEELEKVCSGQGIVYLAEHFGYPVSDAKSFFNRLNQGETGLQIVFNTWLTYLTDFLKWIDRYYAPKAFILTGGVLKSKQFFWDALQASVPHIPLALAQFGQDAGLIGAAHLALTAK
jgi:glucokinase